MPKFTTFLMFVKEQHGKAEQAVNFYVSLFPNSKIIRLERFGAADGEAEGTIKHALFSLDGQEFMAMESGRDHRFSFTPAMSIFVNCQTEDEIDRVFGQLGQGGTVLMELDRYPFSRKYAWLNDKFGVSWQLNLP
jgi:predicted 3-demethylubiquinone-9 3-methyltransferase (glyoxalase superfamily)